MTRAPISPRPVAALLVAASLLALALAPATAGADPYPIDYCKVWGPERVDSPAAVLPGLTVIGDAQSDNNCGAGGSGGAVRLIVPGNTIPFNGILGLRLEVPADRPNITIKRLQSSYRLLGPNAGSSLAFAEIVVNDVNRLDSAVAPVEKVDDRLVPSGTRTVAWRVFCSTSASTNCYWSTPYIADLFKARLSLDEAVAPTLTVDGGTLVAAGAKAGLQSVAFDARDADSGLRGVTVALGATVVGAAQYPCYYDDWSACQRERADQVVQVDTTKVPDGTHELFVNVTDAANNTLTRSFGAITVANGPSAGAPNGSNASRLAKITARYATTRARSRALRYGSRPTVRGRLVDERGTAIGGATVAVLQRRSQAGADRVQVATVTTGADGRFSYRLNPGPSRTITFAYFAYSADAKPATTSSLRTRVRALLSARITPRSVRAGARITMRGRLRLLPREGVEVKIQARDGAQWRVIGEVHTTRGGHFRWRYRFKAGAAGRTFGFRARVASAIYPFASANSKPMVVRVR